MAEPDEAPEATPSARRAGVHAAWTVAIGILVSVLVTVLIDNITGIAAVSREYVNHLVGGLGLRTVIWTVWVVAIAVRYRQEPVGRRAQLATGAGLAAAFIDSLINGIHAAGTGEFGTAAFAIVPVIIGIVVFTVASAVGAYGAIPLAREGKRTS